MRLGQRLLEARQLLPAQLDAAVAEQKRSGGKLGEVLVRLRFVTELQLVEALASQLGIGWLDLEQHPPLSSAALSRLTGEQAHQLAALPLELLEGGALLAIAVAELPRGGRLEQLRAYTRAWVVPRLVVQEQLMRSLVRYYGAPPALPHQPSAAPNAPLTNAVPAHLLPTNPEVRALVAALVERGVISWEDYRRHLSTRNDLDP